MKNFVDLADLADMCPTMDICYLFLFETIKQGAGHMRQELSWAHVPELLSSPKSVHIFQRCLVILEHVSPKKFIHSWFWVTAHVSAFLLHVVIKPLEDCRRGSNFCPDQGSNSR